MPSAKEEMSRRPKAWQSLKFWRIDITPEKIAIIHINHDYAMF
jgi:hypothetical protein